MTAKRILVIDDEDDIREVAKACLEIVGGYDVLTASSGREGLAKASAEMPDAILLDVMMPGMDGPTTFKKLLGEEATRNIPVIFLTAKVQSVDWRQLTELRPAGMIAKPFAPLGLAPDVAKLLGWD
ncbi:MAG TPA: response regulator [Chloroflexota bacterium]|nr:response regulator [Chloroflexota bacterium]